MLPGNHPGVGGSLVPSPVYGCAGLLVYQGIETVPGESVIRRVLATPAAESRMRRVQGRLFLAPTKKARWKPGFLHEEESVYSGRHSIFAGNILW